MDYKYRWIAQDADGVIWKYPIKEPEQGESIWLNMDRPLLKTMLVARGTPNPNWKDSLIDLEKEDYEIVDGILTRKPKAEVSISELTDTDLLDLIVKHELRVEAYACVVHVGTTYGKDVSNKKGDLRKAIKKWLKKNVDKKETKE